MKTSAQLLVLALLLIFAAVGFAQDDPSPDRKKGWDSLSAESQKRLKRKFEAFKNLPPEEQERFRRRHEEFLRLERKVMEDLKDELTGLSARERKSMIEKRVRAELRSLERAVKKKKIFEREPPRDSERHRSRVLRRELEKKNKDLASRILRKLRTGGVITEEEHRRIEALSHEEKVAAVLNLRKKQVLRAVEEGLPPEEFHRFERMPWRPFRDEVDRQRREKGLPGNFAKICELTPEQRKMLKEIGDRSEREKKKRLFFDENFRHHFRAMGISDEKIDEILSLPIPRRLESIMKVLRQIPPDRILPHLRGLLRKPPPPDGTDRPGPGARRPNGAGRGNHRKPNDKPPGGFGPKKRRPREDPAGEGGRPAVF